MSPDDDSRPPLALVPSGAPAPPSPPSPIIELLPRADLAAGPAPPVAEPPARWWLAALLFAATLFTTTALSPVLLGWSRTDMSVVLEPFLTPALVARVFRDAAWLRTGLSFSLPALTILLAHELGHYLACRRYRLPATPPFFLPLPLMLGTLGAFIRIRAPIDGKKELFDVGIAGPLAGFVTLLPFLFYGVAHSRPAPVVLGEGVSLLVPGSSLALELVSRLFHGPLPPGWTLDLHPFAFAAWFGLLVTAINLIPLGQLDGGHILYAVSARWQRRLALPLWIALLGMGLVWHGWLVWCTITLLMNLRHPPVRHEHIPLDRRRRLLAAVALVVLVLSFVPHGLDERTGPVAPPGAAAGAVRVAAAPADFPLELGD